MTEPSPFVLCRDTDVTGVSGTGVVAEGVQFGDGTVVIRWRGENASTVIWESLAHAMAIHGHDGKTRAIWMASASMESALRLDRIGGWHKRETGQAGRVGDFCTECGHRWPCDTRQMADGTYKDDDD